ncbi:MAG: flagellar hook-length control protein FliK [Phycisphaerae bacterium]
MGTTAIQIADLLIPQAPRPRMMDKPDPAQSDGLLTGLAQTQAQSQESQTTAEQRASTDMSDTRGRETSRKGAVVSERRRIGQSKDDEGKSNEGKNAVRPSFAAILEMLAAGGAVELPEGASIQAVAGQTEAPAEGQVVEVVIPQPAGNGSDEGEAAQGNGGKLMLIVPAGAVADGKAKPTDAAGVQMQAGVKVPQQAAQADAAVRVAGKVSADAVAAGKADGATESKAATGGTQVERAPGQLNRQQLTGESGAGGESARQRVSVVGESGEQVRQSEQTSAAVEPRPAGSEPARVVRAAEAVQDSQTADNTNQQLRNAAQTATRNTGELRQAVGDQTGQTSQNGAENGRQGAAAAEKFQTALREAAGPEAQIRVSGRGREGDQTGQPQPVTQVASEAQPVSGQSQATQAGTIPAGPRTPASQVADTVAETVNAGQARAGRQLTIRLNPPELGSVRITFESDGQQLRGTLEVSNPRTLGELQRELPALMSRLSDSGVQLRRMDLNLADNGGGSANSQLSDFGNSQAQTGERGYSGTAGPAEPEAEPAAETTVSVDTPQSAQISDDVINVWI